MFRPLVSWGVLVSLAIVMPPTAAIEKAASSRQPTRVIIDKDGFVRVNGRRRYLYGAFRDPSDSITEFAGLKQARFALTHAYLFEVQLNGSVQGRTGPVALVSLG